MNNKVEINVQIKLICNDDRTTPINAKEVNICQPNIDTKTLKVKITWYTSLWVQIWEV